MDMHTYWVDETKRNETKNKTKKKIFKKRRTQKLSRCIHQNILEKKKKERKKRKMDRFNNMSQGDQ